MKSIPVLGIPFYNRLDLLFRCVASIDHPVDDLVIIRNGKEMVEFVNLGDGPFLLNDTQQCRVPDCVRNVTVIRHPNAGVAASWNEIIQLFPSPWWMIVNNDIAFSPGDLGKMAQTVEEGTVGCPGDPVGMVMGNHGASWFAVTSRGMQDVGLFDENFYPAYLEDCDWHHRARLAAVPMTHAPGVASIHGEGEMTGSCTIHSDPSARENNHRTHGGNFDYYRLKWGGINGQETFTHPYNDPALPVWAWRYSPAFRATQQWN